MDKTALQSYVDFAKKYADKEEEYTPSTWNAFKAAYDKAQEVLKDEKAAQKEVDDALAKLQKAAVDLEMKPSKEKLEELKKAIKAAEKKDLSGYTDASVEAYKDVVEKAKTMLSDKETTATEVEDMLKTLKDADKLLVEKDNPQEEDKKHPDSQKGQAVQTGDQTPIMFWAFMLVASAVVIFRRRKRA